MRDSNLRISASQHLSPRRDSLTTKTSRKYFRPASGTIRQKLLEQNIKKNRSETKNLNSQINLLVRFNATKSYWFSIMNENGSGDRP